MNSRTIFAAVFIFAFTAVSAAFAQTDEDAPKKSKKNGNKEAAETVQPEEGTRFKINGVAEAGFDIDDRTNDPASNKGGVRNRVIGRGEIEMSARPVKKVRAEFGIEYNMRDTFIVVDKLYGQYNVTNDGTLRVGLMKKSFGLEERAGVDERYFHRRSIINGELESLGFLGHDLTLMYRHEIGTEWRFTGGVSWALDDTAVTNSSSWKIGDSTSYLQNYSAQYSPNENMTFIFAAVVKHLSYSGATTFASSLSFAHKAKPTELLGIESDAEITLGSRKAGRTVPRLDSNGNTILDDDFNPVNDSLMDNFTVLGARAQERFPVNLENKILRQIIPIVEIAAYWNDLNGGIYDAQLRAGLAFGFAKNSAFQFRNAYSALMRTQDGNTDFTRYRWDSEIVVIF
jgi:hypothetical protein